VGGGGGGDGAAAEGSKAVLGFGAARARLTATGAGTMGMADEDDEDEDDAEGVVLGAEKAARAAPVGDGDGEDGEDGEDADAEEADRAGSEAAVPSQWVARRVTVPVRCAVRFVDMEGSSDGRSIKAILSRVAPHKLVLIRGDSKATDHLAEYCRSVADTTNAESLVFAPSVGEAVDGSSNGSAYTVRLSDALLRTLAPVQIGAYEISTLSATLHLPPADGAARAWSGVLEPETCLIRSDATSSGSSVHLVSHGDVRLAELRQLLVRAGEHAEFVEGALVVNSSVRVRKKGANKLLLEGSYGPDYLLVRSMLYSQVEAV
jgi:cleavage and polyadenylation specificity factor subunit 2